MTGLDVNRIYYCSLNVWSQITPRPELYGISILIVLSVDTQIIPCRQWLPYYLLVLQFASSVSLISFSLVFLVNVSITLFLILSLTLFLCVYLFLNYPFSISVSHCLFSSHSFSLHLYLSLCLFVCLFYSLSFSLFLRLSVSLFISSLHSSLSPSFSYAHYLLFYKPSDISSVVNHN